MAFAIAFHAGHAGSRIASPSAAPDVELRYLDDKKMGKAYLSAPGDWKAIPGAEAAGRHPLARVHGRAPVSLLRHRRDQVRVFLVDKRASTASATRTPTRRSSRRASTQDALSPLTHDAALRLHAAIVRVMREAVDEVARETSRSRPRCATSSRCAARRSAHAAAPRSARPACAPWTLLLPALPARGAGGLVDWTKTGK